ASQEQLVVNNTLTASSKTVGAQHAAASPRESAREIAISRKRGHALLEVDIQREDSGRDHGEPAPFDPLGYDFEFSLLRMERDRNGARAIRDARRQNRASCVISERRQVIPAVRTDDRVEVKIRRKRKTQAHLHVNPERSEGSALVFMQ